MLWKSVFAMVPGLQAGDLGVALKRRDDVLGALRPKSEQHPLHAHLLVRLDRLLRRRHAEHAHRDWPAARFLGPRLQFLDLLAEHRARAPTDRHPAIAVLDHTVERAWPGPANQHGRMRLLCRLRPAPNRVEIHELAVE